MRLDSVRYQVGPDGDGGIASTGDGITGDMMLMPMVERMTNSTKTRIIGGLVVVLMLMVVQKDMKMQVERCYPGHTERRE